jgi:uncharacterized membrane protein
MKSLLFIVPFFALSCNNGGDSITSNKKSINNSDDSFADTTTVTLDTFQQNTKRPQGIYQVMLPCTDCKGIEHTVSFNQDLTYRLEENKWGKNEQSKAEGRWQPIDGKIWLYQNDTVKARYTWHGDTLVYLQPEGKTFTMQKLIPVTENAAWQKKEAAGVEFFGVGNEPFWNIEIDEQKKIAFHLADWPQPKQFNAVKPVIYSDSIVYSTQSDSTTLTINVYNKFCSDGMSDFIYSHSVKVVYNGQVYNGCGMLYK